MRSIVRHFHTLSRIGVRKGVRRLFQIGGLQAIELPDPRIIPHITVDPFLIERRLLGFCDKHGPLFRTDLDIEGRATSIEESLQRSIRLRFFQQVIVHGMDPDETDEFKYFMDVIAQKGRARGTLRNKAQVLDYLNGKIRIYHEIRKSGEMRPSRGISGRRRDEIGCIIDDHGRLMKVENGNNRFAIARMLDLGAIPVQIDAIHANQLPVIERMEGRTPIQKVNAYLRQVESRHAPQEMQEVGRRAVPVEQLQISSV